MDYNHIFAQAIDRLHAEGRYRVFIDILRNKGAFPNARCFAGHNGPKPITVWCSNDYLCMGQHADVVAAMEEALHDVGAGSGGTRNIGGNTHYHVELEAELAAAAPRPVRFVDGKEGIARRTAWLTREIDWPAGPGEGIALFTGRATDVEAYRAGLAQYGLTRLERL